MIKNVLSDVGGVGVFGIISICLFFTTFTGAILYSLLFDKAHARAMSELPLNDGSTIPAHKGERRHE